MEGINFDDISAEAILTDIRKDRVALRNRKPATKRPRRGSESDIIDTANKPVAADTSNIVEEAEEENPALCSPKRIMPPRNALQTQLFNHLASVLQNRNRAKSETDTAEPQTKPKVTMTKPEPTVRNDVPNSIKTPGLFTELKKNIRVRPRTMDLGDLNIIENLNRQCKKSPAPDISKIIEGECTTSKEKLNEVIASDTKVPAPTNQDKLIKDLQLVNSPDVPAQNVLKVTTSKSAEQAQKNEKKDMSQSSIEPKTILNKSSTQMSTISSSITQTQKLFEDKQLQFNVQTFTSSSSKAVEASKKINEEVTGKSYNKEIGAQILNIQKEKHNINKNTSTTIMKNKSKEIGVIKSSVVSEKSAEPYTTTKPILHTKSNETKVLPIGQVKPKHADNTLISTKSTEEVKIQNTSPTDNLQQKTTLGKRLGTYQMSESPSKPMHTTSNDTIIKNAADKLSDAKSINPSVINSSHQISQANIATEKSKSNDKIVNTSNENSIKQNDTDDNKAVREIMNDLMEEKYKKFKENKNQNAVDSKSTGTIPGDIPSTNNVKVAETNEPSRFTKVEKVSVNKVLDKDNNVTPALIHPESKSKDLSKFKNLDNTKYGKDSPTPELPFKDSMVQSKINADVDVKSQTDTKKFGLNKLSGSRAPPMSSGTNNSTSRIDDVNKTDKKTNVNQITKSIENLSENFKTPSNFDKHSRKIGTTFGSTKNIFKEDLSTATESFASVSKIKFEGNSNKVEKTSSNISGITEQPVVKTKTDILINNFRIRNNISKETAIENLQTNEGKTLATITKTAEPQKTTNENKSISNTKLNDTTINSDNPKEDLDPFGGNRRNNIFRKQSFVQDDPKEAITTESKISISNTNNKDIKITTPEKDISANIGSSWKSINARLSNTKTSHEKEVNSHSANKMCIPEASKFKNGIPDNLTNLQGEKANLGNVTTSLNEIKIRDGSQSAAAIPSPIKTSYYNMPRSFEMKKDISHTPTDTNQNIPKNARSFTRSSSTDTTFKDSPIKLSVPTSPTSPTISTKPNIPPSFAIKKDISYSSTDTNKKIPNKSGGLVKSSPDLIRSSSIKALNSTSNSNITEIKKDASISSVDKSTNIDESTNFPAFRKLSTYKELLNKSSKQLIPEKEVPKTQSDEKINSAAKKSNTHIVVENKSYPKVNTSEIEPIAENKWRRPVTLILKKEELKASTDTPRITSTSSTTFLQGNKISKSVFDNEMPSLVPNINSKPAGSLTSLEESEPANKQKINKSRTKSTSESASTPTTHNVSPASRHESPTFNKMFLPKSTFRSPTSTVNKSTEDIHVVTRSANSSRQNRPQSLSGGDHITIQRTMSATSKIESTIKEKNESITAEVFQAWKVKRKINP